jgi:hypothetical protein
MKTNVPESSVAAYHTMPLAKHKTQQDRIVEAVEAIGGWVSRRQIAQYTGMETATVSARVNAQVGARLVQDECLSTCPITGKSVHKVRLR